MLPKSKEGRNMSLLQCVILVAVLGCYARPSDAKIRQTADAIIVEAEEWPSNNRQARSNMEPHQPKVPGSTFMMMDRTCWTPEGRMGYCGTVRSCYPNFKLPPLSNLETWVLGTKGTCHYLEPDGRQIYGLCCPRHPAEIEDSFMENHQRPASQIWNGPEPEYVAPTNPEDSSKQQLSFQKSSCGKGPYRTLSLDEQSRIVGGQTAVPHSWPFIISLTSNGRHFCGGSIKDATTIITAAHCISHFTSFDIPKLDVVLGLHSISPVDSSAVKMKITRIIRHKGYNGKTMVNDIALLVLSEPIKFNDRIMPVCMPSSDNKHTGKEATAIGWGSLRSGGGSPSALQQVTVKVLPNHECDSKYGTQYDIVDHMLCAASPGKDSCQGDSGGPLVIQGGRGQPWHLAGIVSWGIGCAEERYPGVYTRVSHFLDWIGRNSK